MTVWLSFSVLCGQSLVPERDLPSRALTLLGAESVREKAWGAYLCGTLQVAACRAPLVAQLERAASLVGVAAEGEEFFLVQSLLEGLIRVRAEVPADLALRFWPRWRDEVMVLLVLGQPNEEELLRLEGNADLTYAEWQAVSDRLLTRRSKPFFLRMLKQAKIEHIFIVVDGGTRSGIPGWIGDGILPVSTTRRVPVGFPPIGVYELTSHARPFGTLLSEGPCGTVHFERVEIREEGTPTLPRLRFPVRPTIECRNAYLGQFAGIARPYRDRIFRGSTEVRWVSAAGLAKEATTAMDAQAASLRLVLRQVGIEPLVDPATFRVVIMPQVVDLRANKSVPLPRIGLREVGLR